MNQEITRGLRRKFRELQEQIAQERQDHQEQIAHQQELFLGTTERWEMGVRQIMAQTRLII